MPSLVESKNPVTAPKGPIPLQPPTRADEKTNACKPDPPIPMALNVYNRAPPILLASLGNDPLKKTVLIYGHLDVFSAFANEGWKTDPFKLTEAHGHLYGRGVSSPKGPLVAWLLTIWAYLAVLKSLPVNLKFCLESTATSKDPTIFRRLLGQQKFVNFVQDVTHICATNSAWLTERRPCLTYAFRGICYFGIEIDCASRDLHSGTYGGLIHEAMNDLIWILAQLSQDFEQKAIPNLLRDTPTKAVVDNLDSVTFDVDAYNQCLLSAKPACRTTRGCLEAKWFQTVLSIHGIEGAYHGVGYEPVIPGKVTGKFSIRISPGQNPEQIKKSVITYLNALWRRRGSPNVFRALCYYSVPPWITNPRSEVYRAAANAMHNVHGLSVNFIHDSGCAPALIALQEASQAPIVVMPISCSSNRSRQSNEKIARRSIISGSKVFASFLAAISTL